MSDGTSNSIINIDITKPAVVLIEKVSAAVGWVAAPFQIKRLAKADAEANIIRAQNEIETALTRAQGEIQITEFHQRAARRFIEEEAKKQENMEQITAKALPLLNEQSKPETMDDDWITNFFDKCRIVSDQEMQKLWSKVLAGEANAPGTYSKRTVSFLSDLDKNEAELFSQLCGFGWNVHDTFSPLIYDVQNEIYTSKDINFATLSHLMNIGLVQFNNITLFHLKELPKCFSSTYYGHSVECEILNDTNNTMKIGRAMLTQVGLELAPICGSQPVEGFKEYILEKWQSMGYLKKEVQ